MNHDDLINKYLGKELSSTEEVLFNELLKSDAVFKEELTFQTNLKKAISAHDDDVFKNILTRAESEHQQQKVIPLKRSFTKWMAAASIIFVLGFSYMLMQNNTTSTNDLFATNFEPYRNVIAPIVRGEEQKDEKSKAFLAYEKGEYEVSVLLFSKLYKITNEPYYLFYQANALLKLERADEAIPLLQEHLKTNDTLTQKTNWYLALAYLKAKETDKAKETLRKVVSEKSYKNKDAVKLLQELE
ncbi:MAG: tetratricopeptide repeat protein [Flavobacteriaceae bacterium]